MRREQRDNISSDLFNNVGLVTAVMTVAFGYAEAAENVAVDQKLEEDQPGSARKTKSDYRQDFKNTNFYTSELKHHLIGIKGGNSLSFEQALKHRDVKIAQIYLWQFILDQIKKPQEVTKVIPAQVIAMAKVQGMEFREKFSQTAETGETWEEIPVGKVLAPATSSAPSLARRCGLFADLFNGKCFSLRQEAASDSSAALAP